MKYLTKCFMLLLGIASMLTQPFLFRYLPYSLPLGFAGAILVGLFWFDVVFPRGLDGSNK